MFSHKPRLVDCFEVFMYALRSIYVQVYCFRLFETHCDVVIAGEKGCEIQASTWRFQLLSLIHVSFIQLLGFSMSEFKLIVKI